MAVTRGALRSQIGSRDVALYFVHWLTVLPGTHILGGGLAGAPRVEVITPGITSDTEGQGGQEQRLSAAPHPGPRWG